MDERIETLEMLQVLIEQSKGIGKNITVIENVDISSFQFVINEAAKIINRSIMED